jgi:hypothetical protein
VSIYDGLLRHKFLPALYFSKLVTEELKWSALRNGGLKFVVVYSALAEVSRLKEHDVSTNNK